MTTVTRIARPANHAAIVSNLLEANPDLTYRDSDQSDIAELFGTETAWWEEITVPVVVEGVPNYNLVSVDYNSHEPRWQLSIWPDDDSSNQHPTAYARALAEALTRAASIADYIKEATK